MCFTFISSRVKKVQTQLKFIDVKGIALMNASLLYISVSCSRGMGVGVERTSQVPKSQATDGERTPQTGFMCC